MAEGSEFSECRQRLQGGLLPKGLASLSALGAGAPTHGPGRPEAQAAKLPESAGVEAQPTVWRDGTVQTAQSGSFGYQPGGKKRRRGFAVVRHRAAEELFGHSAFLTTHDQEGSARLACEPHRGKREKERLWSEGLRDLGSAPCAVPGPACPPKCLGAGGPGVEAEAGVEGVAPAGRGVAEADADPDPAMAADLKGS